MNNLTNPGRCVSPSQSYYRNRSLIPIGALYGRWTVIDNTPYAPGRRERACRVRCTCGNEKTLRASNLRSGKSTSCGCKVRERSIDAVWVSILASLRCRGFDCHITLPQLKVLAKFPCVYCGKEPSNIHRLRYSVDGKQQTDPTLEIRWSGLDRIDSSRGYICGNIVPCCNRCNCMKNNMPLDDFFALLDRIRAHNPTPTSVREFAITMFAS